MVATRRGGASKNDGPSATNVSDDTSLAVIPKLHQKQVSYFERHATRPLEWRKAQLQALYNAVQDNRDDWTDALNTDLGKNKIEALRVPS